MLDNVRQKVIISRSSPQKIAKPSSQTLRDVPLAAAQPRLPAINAKILTASTTTPTATATDRSYKKKPSKFSFTSSRRTNQSAATPLSEKAQTIQRKLSPSASNHTGRRQPQSSMNMYGGYGSYGGFVVANRIISLTRYVYH